MTSLVFVVPAGLDRPTGGNRYDQHLIGALTQLGITVDVREVAGAWPLTDPGVSTEPGAAAGLAAALRSDVPVLVDGLLACGAPDLIRAAVTAGGRVHVLVHMPLALDVGLPAEVAARRDTAERAALHAATGVLAISGWTARDLLRRHGLTGVVVAPPGCRPAPPAPGSDPPRLLHLAAVTPVKDQLGVVGALARIRDLPWTAWLTGDDQAAPEYAAAVRDAVRERGLAERVRLTGPLTGDDLDAALAATDLLLLPSRAETWGMAVTEALARGIPAVVSAGTGAVEALTGAPFDPADAVPDSAAPDSAVPDSAAPDSAAPERAVPGAVVPTGDPRALADAVRALLGPDRERARAAARRRRALLPDWAATARTVRDALTGHDALTGRDALPAHPVDPSWLALREGADARARASGAGELVRLLAAELSRREHPLRVVDLGSGTGANPRWLAPLIGDPVRQRWTTVDHDAALTVQAPVATTAVIADVAGLEAVLTRIGGADLVTAAALLDLLDRPRLSAIIDAVVQHGAAALFSLNVDGDVVIDPADPDDRPLAEAFDAHQRRGGRLGPDAAAATVAGLRARGWRVTRARTPWRLGSPQAPSPDADLIRAWLRGRAEAAAEWEPQHRERSASWLRRRDHQVATGGLQVVVGHVDVLALPPRRGHA